MIVQTLTRLHRTSQSSSVALASSVSARNFDTGSMASSEKVCHERGGKIQLGFIVFFHLEVVETMLGA